MNEEEELEAIADWELEAIADWHDQRWPKRWGFEWHIHRKSFVVFSLNLDFGSPFVGVVLWCFSFGFGRVTDWGRAKNLITATSAKKECVL